MKVLQECCMPTERSRQRRGERRTRRSGDEKTSAEDVARAT